MPRLPLRHRSTLILGLLGAALLWAAFPPLDLGFLAWIAPIPWVLLVRRKTLDGRRPYATLAFAGFCFWMAALHWLRLPHWATSFGWIVLSCYFALYLPAFVALSRAAVHRLGIPAAPAAATVWAGLELARAYLFTGMSMASLGHTQYRWIELIQVSDLAGVYGVSFVVMFVAASLASVFPSTADFPMPGADGDDGKPTWRIALRLLPAAGLLLAVLLYGHMRLGQAATGSHAGPKIALIQGSIDVEMRYDPDMKSRIFQQYFSLSEEAVRENRHVDLVVWPETMFLEPLVTFDARAARPPQFDCTDAEFHQQLERIARLDREKKSSMAWLARKLGAPLLLGVDANHFGADRARIFNSAAFVARDGGLLGRYDKMHLVMFGEYVPLADRFPWLQRLTPLPVSATPGERPAVFELRFGKGETCRIAPNICYESVLSRVIRRQVNTLTAEGREPDVLVNLTNDGWFWGSSELDMHLVCGVFRAVECRKPFLIAANTGFSAWIDADGRIRAQGRRRATDIVIAQPRLAGSRRSWYLVHGDWFAGACLVACGLFACVGLRRRRVAPPAA